MTVLSRCLLLSTALLAGSIGTASAAAHLKTAMPGPGSTVAAAPTELRFTFDGAMRPKPTAVALTGAGGRIPLAPATLVPDDDRTLVLPIAGPLSPGSYKVDWHATAADGRKVSGSYGFTIIP
ncbi:MAG: copper resistance protein CopC [Caulobacteraceae bacterium]|nr:copper resistance protein CopC [Caulobacter sp.]